MVFAKLSLALLHDLSASSRPLPPALFPICRSQVAHACQCVGMVLTELRLAHFYHLNLELLGLFPPALVPVRRRQVGHTRQRVRMVLTELRLARLHHLHLELLGLFPPALVPIRRR